MRIKNFVINPTFFQPNSLQYFCIETIGRNIFWLSRKANYGEKLTESGFLGEQIVYSSISNSFLTGLDATSLGFVFDKFYVRRLTLHKHLSEKLQSLQFLNGKYLQEFVVFAEREFLVEKDNFELNVDELKVYFEYGFAYRRNRNFFKNIRVKKKLFVKTHEIYFTLSVREAENFLPMFLENVSDDLEYLELSVPKYCLSSNIKKYLSGKKNLREFRVNDQYEIYLTLNDYLTPSPLRKLTVFRINVGNGFDCKRGYEIFKYLDCLVHLDINLSDQSVLHDINAVRSLLYQLQTHNAKRLKILKIILDNDEHYKFELADFLSACTNLQDAHLVNSLGQSRNFLLYVNQLIFPSLRILDLESFRQPIKYGISQFKLLFSRSNISEIYLRQVKNLSIIFGEFLYGLDKLKDHLKIIHLIGCDVGKENLLLFTKSIEKCEGLKEFFFDDDNIDENIYMRTFKSLMKSAKTLKSIAIFNRKTVLFRSYPTEMLEFLIECEQLEIVCFYFSAYDEGFPDDLALVLTKFCETLKTIYIPYVFHRKYKDSMNRFLSKCKNLTKFLMIFPPWHSDGGERNEIMNKLENSKYSLFSIDQIDGTEIERIWHIFPRKLEFDTKNLFKPKDLDRPV